MGLKTGVACGLNFAEFTALLFLSVNEDVYGFRCFVRLSTGLARVSHLWYNHNLSRSTADTLFMVLGLWVWSIMWELWVKMFEPWKLQPFSCTNGATLKAHSKIVMWDNARPPCQLLLGAQGVFLQAHSIMHARQLGLSDGAEGEVSRSILLPHQPFVIFIITRIKYIVLLW